MTHSTHSELIRGLAALAVCILLAVPSIAAAQFWTDPQTGDTWTTDPETCGPRFDWFGSSWVAIQTWTDPQTGAVWTTDPRGTGPRVVAYGCLWVEILVWVSRATTAIWTTDPNAVGPMWAGYGHTWTNIVTPGGNAQLARLTMSVGGFDQIFQSSLNNYTATVSLFGPTTTVTSKPTDPNACARFHRLFGSGLRRTHEAPCQPGC